MPSMRWAERINTVLLTGTIHDGRATMDCPVLNISEFGLMVRIDFPADVGLRVAVEMRGMPLAAANSSSAAPRSASAGTRSARMSLIAPVISASPGSAGETR